MEIKAVRLHGASMVSMDTFELPPIKDDEILVKVITNSLCMSTYKAAIRGTDHQRVPNDVAENPVITGHEFAGEIVEVGAKWQDQFKAGEKFTVQPALNYKGSPYSPGYSYKYFGGNATYTILPQECMELGCLLKYEGEGFYNASLAEPMSCIIGAYNAHYHTKFGDYQHYMGIKDQGRMLILAGAGPMGLGAIDYVLHHDTKPSQLIVVDINDERLDRAQVILPVQEGTKQGVDLQYVNGAAYEDIEKHLMDLTDGNGFDDVFVYAPVQSLVELGDRVLGKDGCLNFFAGPTDTEFKAAFNFYNVHYKSTHLVGTSGGNTDDMRESLQMTAEGRINPAVMVTHIGGLNSASEAILQMPKLSGGKKLIYTGVRMDLTAIDDFRALGESNPVFAKLADLVDAYQGLWNTEAENYLLEHMEKI